MRRLMKGRVKEKRGKGRVERERNRREERR
jgi:hypothetical protein